ncbi:flagellar basal body-associated protein FliL [Cellvibrio sp. KB43]|uniref:Flagellar protein FliL n=1 Tax=Cellvibrio polysaccharolyticus TaxID=2082724 RepID=A0A928UZG8_9GAMM|nr:flagellar basal body-associated protein FliL [Cellvibrio polysaccharolyticus]
MEAGNPVCQPPSRHQELCEVSIRIKSVKGWLLIAMAGCMALMAGFAQASAPAAAPDGVSYITFSPLVVNYGSGPRMKYLKAEISVRVADGATATAVQHHMPLLRNGLVMLFSQQSEEAVGSPEGKESLRQQALTAINQLIHEETGQGGVVDLFFNNLILQ